jgi:hypothetical protein
MSGFGVGFFEQPDIVLPLFGIKQINGINAL